MNEKRKKKMQLNLLDILTYTRCHGGKTETKFIENYLKPAIEWLGYQWEDDPIGNVWVTTGDAPVLFTAHIDTCHRGEGMIKPIVRDNWVSVNPDDIDRACLGADDGVGMYVNLKLMEAGISGTYLFTRGEEKGGIGASYVAQNMSDKLKQFQMCIEVDRAGYDEIIIDQSYGKCASRAFANALATQIGMNHSPSEHGVYTDNAEFTAYIPECVNISAGYFNQHTVKETVDLEYVDQIVDSLVKVDYTSLPICRDTNDFGDDEYYKDSPVDDYWALFKYCESNPEKVAHFLEAIGVTTYEIDREIENYWGDDCGLAVGL